MPYNVTAFLLLTSCLSQVAPVQETTNWHASQDQAAMAQVKFTAAVMMAAEVIGLAVFCPAVEVHKLDLHLKFTCNCD